MCFSEIPLARLVQRRSLYGIGFSKSYVLAQGGGPVWYVQYASPAHLALKHQVERALSAPSPPQEPIWSTTPVVDIQGDHHNAPYSYRFDWEREWRVPGLLRFTEYDVAELFLPGEFHDTARDFFTWAVREKAGPGDFCPCLDPLWTSEQIAYPALQPAVDRFVGRILLPRQLAPLGPGAQNPQDAVPQRP